MSTIAEIFASMEYGPAPESPAPALAWLEERSGSFGHFVDGGWREPAEGAYLETASPADGRALARVARGGAADVAAAVAAPHEAFPAWHGLGGHTRALHLYALAHRVQEHAALFALLETLDTGRPIRRTRLDVRRAERCLFYHAGSAQSAEDEPALRDLGPLGVVGQILPWQAPLGALGRRVAPALAAGNTVVVLPAETTPLTALLFADLARATGLPAGVLNLVTGDARTGQSLVEHPDVAGIDFTGPTEIARRIREATAGSGKRVSLEPSGGSTLLVFDDADRDSAVEAVLDGTVGYLLVQESVAAGFVDRLRARMRQLRVGDPLDRTTDIGAVHSPEHLEALHAGIRHVQEDGARVWQPPVDLPPGGCFHPPTLLTEVPPSSAILRQQCPGPVVVLATFRTPDDAVALARDARPARAAGVWTADLGLALDVAHRLDAATVAINGARPADADDPPGSDVGRAGLGSYLREAGRGAEPEAPAWNGGEGTRLPADARPRPGLPPIDRVARVYIDGRQTRPVSGAALPVLGRGGQPLGSVGRGGDEDLLRAVEAARRAGSWATQTAGARARILLQVAETLAALADELTDRIAAMTGRHATAAREVERSIASLYTCAARADDRNGWVQAAPRRGLHLAVREPIGVIGIVCPDEAPLLGLVSTVFPALAAGNRVVAVPSGRHPLVATDLYPVLDTSNLPAGVLNLVTGDRDGLAAGLAAHATVAAVWYWGGAEGRTQVERLAAGNLKRTWVGHAGPSRGLAGWPGGFGEVVRRATRVRSIRVSHRA